MYYHVDKGLRTSGLRQNPINALVAPRPIGWVSTVDGDGRRNLAPFSYFNLVSADPPVVMFAPNEKDEHGTPKDSLRNVRETHEFVVNIVSWRLRLAMNATSAVLEHGVNEFELAGLSEAPSIEVRAPRIAEAPAALECRVYEILPLPHRPGQPRSHVVLGEVRVVHIDDGVIRDGIVDTLLIAPTARLGGLEYMSVNWSQTIERP